MAITSPGNVISTNTSDIHTASTVVECPDFRTESASGAVDKCSWYAFGRAIYPVAVVAHHTLWVDVADDMQWP